jgi:hypothetical protein
VGKPAELGAINAHEEDPVGNLRTRIAGSFGKARDLASHATTQSASCWTKFSTCSRVASLRVFVPQKSTA